jgi:hypothetical protein
VKSLSLILALALLLLTTVSAQSFTSYARIPLIPPAEYDYPFDGDLTVNVVSQDEIRELCAEIYSKRPKTAPAIGCARRRVSIKKCAIFIAPEADLKALGTTHSIILRDEMGHCNGWPDDHPNARLADDSPPSPAPSNVDAENECHIGTQVVPCSADYDPNYKSPPSPVRPGIHEIDEPAPVRTRPIPTLKSSCQEYLDVSNDKNNLIGVLEFLPLIEGYFRATSEGERIDQEKYMASFLENLDKYCTTNPERPFLDAVRSAYEAMVRLKRDAQVQVIEDLRLREQPDPLARNILGAPPNDKMPKGSQVAVIDTCRTWMGSGRGAQDADNIWCPVLYAGHRGWANAYYLADHGARAACVMYPPAGGCASTGGR